MASWAWCVVWICVCVVFVIISYRAFLVDQKKTELTESTVMRLEKSYKREMESYQVLLKAQRAAFERAKQETEEWKGRYLATKEKNEKAAPKAEEGKQMAEREKGRRGKESRPERNSER